MDRQTPKNNTKGRRGARNKPFDRYISCSAWNDYYTRHANKNELRRNNYHSAAHITGTMPSLERIYIQFPFVVTAGGETGYYDYHLQLESL